MIYLVSFNELSIIEPSYYHGVTEVVTYHTSMKNYEIMEYYIGLCHGVTIKMY